MEKQVLIINVRLIINGVCRKSNQRVGKTKTNKMATVLNSITIAPAGTNNYGVDNELMILAVNGSTSVELFRLKSGYGQLINYTIKLGGILAAGNYYLVIIGINWGGPASFNVQLDPSSLSPASYLNNTAPIGVVWTPTPIAFTV